MAKNTSTRENPYSLITSRKGMDKESAAVAADHQCTENLESLWSASALSGYVFHGFERKPDWINRAERFGEIHVAADFGRNRRAQQRKHCIPQAPAAQLCGAGLPIQSRRNRALRNREGARGLCEWRLRTR